MPGKEKKSFCIRMTILVLLVFGLIALVVGGVLFALFPAAFNQMLQEKLILQEDSESGERFQNPPLGSSMSFYLFNVTNKEEVNSGTAQKPILQEVGPFVFKQYKTKRIISWNRTEGTVRYKENTNYVYDQELSPFDIYSQINHPNLPDIALSTVLSSTYDGINVLPTPPEGVLGPLIVSHSISEVLFEGYSIPYLDWFQANNYFTHWTLQKLGQIPLGNAFGLFYGKNNSESKEFKVCTGETDMSKFMKIASFDHKEELRYWKEDSHCNDINGTDGTQFPPGVRESDLLYVFSNDICRSLLLKFQKPVEIERISALRFSVPESAFAAPNVNQENSCFCMTDLPCTKAGVLPLGPCQSGKPVAMSSPHFYLGDLSYVQAFAGDIRPNKDKHETFIDIEPITGVVLRGKKRLQVNVVTKDNDEFIAHSKEGYFPFAWAEEGGEIDAAKAELFRNLVINPKNVIEWSLVSLMGLGAILILIALYLFRSRRHRTSELQK